MINVSIWLWKIKEKGSEGVNKEGLSTDRSTCKGIEGGQNREKEGRKKNKGGKIEHVVYQELISGPNPL